LSGTFGAPAAHPFGPGREDGAHRDHGLIRSGGAHCSAQRHGRRV